MTPMQGHPISIAASTASTAFTHDCSLAVVALGTCFSWLAVEDDGKDFERKVLTDGVFWLLRKVCV